MDIENTIQEIKAELMENQNWIIGQDKAVFVGMNKKQILGGTICFFPTLSTTCMCVHINIFCVHNFITSCTQENGYR